MKNAPANRPTHIVQGNVFDALGFSASEASALKVKAELLSAILEHVRSKAYTQAQLPKSSTNISRPSAISSADASRK